MNRFLIVALNLCLLFADSKQQECGYASCSKTLNGKLNVHLLCHSHDDVGWLKTVDQYYYGSNRKTWSGDTENQRAGVQYIIDSVVKELAFDPSKKFIQVETAFFWRWWNEQDQRTQNMVKDLVTSGQLEFIGGGWSMNDEAASHYQALIDQMTLGLVKLNSTFGHCGRPRVAWQIDPFGHSQEMASIFAKLGFDGLFFGRLDWRDKATRMANQTMEMMWQAGLYSEDNLFTGVLYNYYFPPSGFCWDVLCNDEPMMDFGHEFNMEQRARDFIAYVKKASVGFRTNHVAITTGMDFHYQAAHAWFKNLDKLIHYVNEVIDEDVFLTYSTPSCYLKALNEANLEWPLKGGDFFPYASDYHAYWTGYYSSRPTSKKMIREASVHLQAAKQVTSQKFFDPFCSQACKKHFLKATETLDRAVAVAQHHDAITGTEQEHVAKDYHLRLDSATKNWAATWNIGTLCPYLNMSICDLDMDIPQSDFSITLYNPRVGHSMSTLVRFAVPGNDWLLLDDQLQNVDFQMLEIGQAVKDMNGRQAFQHIDHEVIFAASIPSSGYKQFTFVKAGQRVQGGKKSTTLVKDQIFQTEKGTYVYDDQLKQITAFIKNDGTEFKFKQSYAYYIGHPGNNSQFEFRASGAYIFRPENQVPSSVQQPQKVLLQEGLHYIQLEMQFEKHVSQLIRLPRSNQSIADLEIEWMIGPIPIEDGKGKEFIHKVVMDNWNNSGIFYTDANGRQNVQRIRNQRLDYDLGQSQIDEPVASNYYPITTWISMTNEDEKSISIVTDRSCGGSSITDDSLEIMLHRRLLDDDAFGVMEPLNETEFDGQGIIARGVHYLLFDSDPSKQMVRTRKLSKEIFHHSILAFDSQVMMQEKEELNDFELPESIHVLTLAIIPETEQLLLRMEHILQPNEPNAKEETVSIQALLAHLGQIGQVQETTLGGNQWKNQLTKLNWNHCKDEKLASDITGPNFNVVLQPFEIRTFIVTLTETQ